MKHMLALSSIPVLLFGLNCSPAEEPARANPIGPDRPGDIKTGLVAHWKFDEASGTTAADRSGNGHEGTLENGAFFTEGKFKNAVEVDGTDDLVSVNGFDVEGPGITLAAWIKPDDFGINDGRIISKANEWLADDHWWMLSTVNTPAVLRFRLKTDDGQAVPTLIASSGELIAGEWAHVAATWDGSTMRLYKDGEEVGSMAKGGSAVATDPTVNVAIGSQPADAYATDPSHVAKYFDGLIDDVRVYNRALSQEEIMELINWSGADVDAGPDQRVEGGTLVTLRGYGPDDTNSFAWEQIVTADEPVVTLSDPNSETTTFTPPAREIGYILTFRFTVVSPSEGTLSDEVLVYVTAPNKPKIAPGNFRTFPANLGYRLEWGPLVDAVDYGVGFKLGPDMYFWFWTTDTSYPLVNLTEGQETLVAVRARNSYGEGTISDDVPLLPMRNYALPTNLGGINPPSDYVYVISHYDLASLNNATVDDDNNDSWDGIYKEEDYWGYTWAAPLYMDHVTYFTGNMFGDGGWFTSLKVQYTKDGVEWLDVPVRMDPPYDFTDQRQGKLTYTRYDMYIPTLYGMGIRIYGTPGGTATFTSVSELEIFGDNATSRPLVVQGIDGEVPERGTGAIDASFSFSTRGDITSMIYSQVSGPEVTITVTGDPLIATFQAPGVDADTELVFEIEGSDGTDTLTDQVTIMVKDLVTTAVAGQDQSVDEGTVVTLDGSGSLTTTGDITYQWTQTSGTTVTLDNPTSAVCTFEAPPAIWDYTEDLTLRLDVDDGAGGVSSDEVMVEVRNSLAWPAWPYTDVAAPTTGYITDMLHLGTDLTDRILGPLNLDLTTSDALAKWGGQAYVNPAPGEEYDFTDTGFTVTRNPMVWTPAHYDDGVFGDEPLDNFQQYYHVYVISPEERAVRFHFMNDDPCRGWNNGGLVFSRDSWDVNVEQTDDGTLYEGLNSMTFKFEEWGGGARIAVGITNEFDELMDDVWCSFGPSFILADAYAVRELPTSYDPGGNIEVTLSVRVDSANKPSNVTITEPIPTGLTVVDAGGGTQIGTALSWSFSGTSVTTQMLSYTLGAPGGVSGSLNFPGTIAFSGTTETIKGDNVIYETPAAPETVYVEMLLVANLSWSASPQEGVVGYRVYRSENGQLWEEIGFVSGTSLTDGAIAEGNTYNYQVAAVNAAGVEGDSSAPTGEKMIVMEVREAEDYNYGGGQWPGYTNCPAALEAPDAATVGTPQQYDFFFATDVPAGDARLDYRPNDNCATELREATVNIGWTTVGDWWRYTFNVPAPGPSDPPEGWVRVILKVSAPGDTTVDLYWDEVLVESLSFVTGDWAIFQHVSNEQYFQTTPGLHTLRVVLSSGQMNFDTIGMGFNWSAPTRETLFEDDFEEDTALYDTINVDWTVINGSGVSDGAWRLWNTAGNWLNNEDPALADMTNNYAITDSDLAGSVDVDEELITPTLDCTGHRLVRLSFNMNYRRYVDDVDHDQIADVDVRTSDDGTTWGNWVNLLRWDINTVAETASGAQEVDLSAHADGKFIQVRWRFHEANYDYWFAVDDIRISGDKVEVPPEKGKFLTIGYVAGVADLTWEAFGPGNYTLQYTGDLTSGSWDPVPGTTWPITATTWSDDISAILGQGAYLRVRSE